MYLRIQKCRTICQKVPDARHRSAATLALNRFSRRGTVPACENRSAAPAVPSLLRPQDAPGMAAFRRGDRGGQAEAFHLDLDGALYPEDRARPAGMQAAGLYA